MWHSMCHITWHIFWHSILHFMLTFYLTSYWTVYAHFLLAHFLDIRSGIICQHSKWHIPWNDFLYCLFTDILSDILIYIYVCVCMRACSYNFTFYWFLSDIRSGLLSVKLWSGIVYSVQVRHAPARKQQAGLQRDEKLARGQGGRRTRRRGRPEWLVKMYKSIETLT